MIIPELALPLSSHPTLGLHHLLGLVGSTLVTLIGIKVLQVGAGVLRSHLVVISNRMAMLGHARALIFISTVARGSRVSHAKFGVLPWPTHHWQRIPSRWPHELLFPTLVQIVESTVDLCSGVSTTGRLCPATVRGCQLGRPDSFADHVIDWEKSRYCSTPSYIPSICMSNAESSSRGIAELVPE